MAEQAMEKLVDSSTQPEYENGGLDQKIDSSTQSESENYGLEKTPPLLEKKIDENTHQDSCNDLRKTCTPDRLKVPKAFKFPERYRSPTDSMMSPVTKGLLARNRRAGGSLLPPSMNQTKIHELRVRDIGLSHN